MKKKNWRKWHKLVGLAFCFFLLLFSVSGIVLNHRHLYGNVNVSRNRLPEPFRFDKWNNGLLRGTLKVRDKVLVYGSGGVFCSDSTASCFRDFSAGMPDGADARNIRSVVKTPRGALFAMSPFNVYRLEGKRWKELPAPFGKLAVAGYSDDFACGGFFTTWYDGTEKISQPPSFSGLPMSLWQLALEVHTGRIYTFMGGAEAPVWVSIAGLLAVIVLWSGWKIRRRTVCRKG
ncbi:MAG: PepSY domain-containing protein [Bacteroidales bacterium]|nr:PepSY domain-containing protein [Bacteroidales bacterium]MCM1146928.1 PepSY domain-containing protein [Bacteroidales bacterium]MCM1205574.1 PepSY domain-containing protein [Bacillota bacterium]MCM1510315.1 PepSY domain-containing protein [Clostridium sp.]